MRMPAEIYLVSIPSVCVTAALLNPRTRCQHAIAMIVQELIYSSACLMFRFGADMPYMSARPKIDSADEHIVAC